MTWERARSEEQIEYRTNEILEATAKLYTEHRFEEMTFVMIAKEAGFTRSNLYRYFKTKEDIFLKLLIHDMTIWRKDVEAGFSGKEIPLSDFSEKWVDTLFKHQRLLEIYTILYTLLERNATLEALVDFKKSIMAELASGTAVIAKVLGLPPEAAMEFLYASISLITGISPLMNLSAKQKEAMDIIGMEMPSEMVRKMAKNSTLSLLKGMIN